MRTTTKLTTTLAALAATLVLAPAAGAAPAAALSGPQPIPADKMDDPVSYDIKVLDAEGAVVKTLQCDWVGPPEDEDMPCIAWAGDLRETVDAITEAGGVGSVTRVVAPHSGVDAVTRISARGDGTWLIRTVGQGGGERLHHGRVCDADGKRCVRWDAGGAKRAQKDVRAAAAKLKRAKR